MALKVQRVPRAELRCTCMVPDRLSLRQMEQIWSVFPTTGWCATGMRCHLTRLSVRRVARVRRREQDITYVTMRRPSNTARRRSSTIRY